MPALTGPNWPSRSPGCGMALPEADTRAATTTFANFESFKSSDMAVLSSSLNVIGSSLTLRFKIASGMRGPCAARAKMNTVSSGLTLLASDGDRLTVPLNAGPGTGAVLDGVLAVLG